MHVGSPGGFGPSTHDYTSFRGSTEETRPGDSAGGFYWGARERLDQGARPGSSAGGVLLGGLDGRLDQGGLTGGALPGGLMGGSTGRLDRWARPEGFAEGFHFLT